MKVFTYSEARQNLASLLERAQSEDVEICPKDGSRFILRAKAPDTKSPLDVPGVETDAGTEDILEAVREVHERS